MTLEHVLEKDSELDFGEAARVRALPEEDSS